MTIKIFSRKSPFWVFSLPLLTLAVLVILSLYSDFISKGNSHFYSALIIDFTLTLPLIYFLLIRKKKISKLSIVPVFILGMLISSLVIPETEQGTLTFILNWIFPFVELFVLGKIGFTVYQLVKNFKESNNERADFYEAFVEASAKIFPSKLKYIVATESSLIYYCFFAWKKTELHESEFSYHHKTPIISLLCGVLLLIVAEGIGIHLWLETYNLILAWVFTLISAYGFLQVFGILKSIPRRPILLKENDLQVKFGLIGNVKIPYSDIESINLTTTDIPPKTKGLKKLFLIEHNIIIHFKKKIKIQGLYGIQKEFSQVAFFVDDVEEFNAKLNSKTSYEK